MSTKEITEKMPPMGDVKKSIESVSEIKEEIKKEKSEPKGVKVGKATTLEQVCLDHLGVSSTEKINDWFRKSYSNNYRLDNLDKFKDIIDRAARNDKEIHIIGDYDVDGVMALTIMYRSIKDYVSKNYPDYDSNRLFVRAPYRFTEGFGLKSTMIDEITDDNSLVITVDNGTVAFDAIDKAKSRGMDVIVTDHHEPDKDENGDVIYPNADLIINPHAVENSADYEDYCGAGLAYKIAGELLGPENAKKYRGFAAIATIADVMELREENYVFVKQGLKDLLLTKNPGMRSLLHRLNLEENISASDVGFSIAPCINAPGRLEDKGANTSVKLFITDDKDEAERLSGHLQSVNIQRKKITAELKKDIDKTIKTENMQDDIPIIMYVPEVCEGLVGILAGHVTEKYNVPSIIFTDGLEEGTLKGSGRAPVGFRFKDVMDRCQSYLRDDGKEYIYVGGGGHNGKRDKDTGKQISGSAAGLTIKKDGFEEYKEYFRKASEEEGFVKSSGKIEYEYEVHEKDIPDAVKTIEMFSPFGEGNKPITVKIPDFKVIPVRGVYKKLLGADGVKLAGSEVSAIGFGMAKEMEGYEKPEEMVLYGTLSYNYFNGNVTPQIEYKGFEVTKAIDLEKTNNTPFKDLLSTMASMREK